MRALNDSFLRVILSKGVLLRINRKMPQTKNDKNRWDLLMFLYRDNMHPNFYNPEMLVLFKYKFLRTENNSQT